MGLLNRIIGLDYLVLSRPFDPKITLIEHQAPWSLDRNQHPYNDTPSEVCVYVVSRAGHPARWALVNHLIRRVHVEHADAVRRSTRCNHVEHIMLDSPPAYKNNCLFVRPRILRGESRL